MSKQTLVMVVEDSIKEFDKTFGNYLLHGIEEIHLPSPIAWYPDTPFWYILLFLMIAWFVKTAWVNFRRWRCNAYRRNAIRQLSQIDVKKGSYNTSLGFLPLVLKTTALSAFPRSEVAALSGRDFASLMESTCPAGLPNSSPSELLETIAYQDPKHWDFTQAQVESLLAACRYWVLHHRVPPLVARSVNGKDEAREVTLAG